MAEIIIIMRDWLLLLLLLIIIIIIINIIIIIIIIIIIMAEIILDWLLHLREYFLLNVDILYSGLGISSKLSDWMENFSCSRNTVRIITWEPPIEYRNNLIITSHHKY